MQIETSLARHLIVSVLVFHCNAWLSMLPLQMVANGCTSAQSNLLPKFDKNKNLWLQNGNGIWAVNLPLHQNLTIYT